jgi:hypothetical protein
MRRHWPWVLIVVLALVLLVGLGAALGAGTFGNVAEWAAALGTIAAFGATVLLLRQEVEARGRDVAERERRQAALVSCWLDDAWSEVNVEFYRAVFVKNASDEPIYHVQVLQEPGQRGEFLLAHWGVIGPRKEETWHWDPNTEDVPTDPVPVLSFVDSAGQQWERDWRGRLHRVPFP